MNRIFLTCFLVSTATCSLLAQGTGLMRTDLISPSPTAANLGKYGETPVTYYTGLPNVSIPIFNITGNELSVPVTLTYNFSGHQPAQKASWVGLGWSLQAGGVITRTIGDKVEQGMGGYDKNTASNLSATQQYLADSYERAMYDNLPDVYSFNFGTYSGKFICYNNVAYVLNDQKLKVTSGGGGFIITAEDGTKYEFGEVEQTFLRGSGSFYNVPAYYSSWYLIKITNATNTESIRLYYDQEGTVMQFGPKVQSYNERRSYSGLYGFAVEPSPPGPPGDVYPTKVITKRLSSIVSDKFAVYFDAGAVREDIEMESGTSKSLASIRVYSSEGLLVKRVNFNYGYFGSGGIHYKFLKLQSVVEEGLVSGAEFMKHRFEYQNENGTFGTGVMSTSDKFGYLMGDGYMPNLFFVSQDDYKYGSARAPNIAYTANGALKKIIYPTGGSTNFTYEANYFYDGDKYVTYNRTAGGQDYTSNHSIRDGHFELFKDTNAEVTYIRTPADPLEPQLPHNNANEFEIRAVYLDARGQEVIGSVIQSGALVISDNNVGHKTVFLEAGKYVIRAICDAEESQVDVVMNWKEVTDIPEPGALGPGIRLKELTHDNGFGNTIKKKFSYVNNNGFSSGKLLQSNFYDARDYSEFFHSTVCLILLILILGVQETIQSFIKL